jgi:hypothetical protein
MSRQAHSKEHTRRSRRPRHRSSLLALVVLTAALASATFLPGAMSSRQEVRLCEKIRVTSQRAVADARAALISYIWSGPRAYPTRMRPSIRDATARFLGDLDGVGSVNEMTFRLGSGLTARAYLVRPAIRTRRTLVIYHEGHVHGFALGRPTIQFFVERGYDVAAVAMPLYRPNNRPHGWTNHARLNVLPGGGIAMFLNPAIGVLNHLAREYAAVAMVGLSGGAWTTVMVAALDRRVTRSYHVSGTLPHCMWPGTGANPLDYESMWPPLYMRSGFLDLYVMGAVARRQMQVQNVFDIGFRGRASKTYESAVNDALGDSGGRFEVVLDTTIRRQHIISRWALTRIQQDLRTLP